MSTVTPMKCPAGCDGELEPMGRWAPYRVCGQCGTGYWCPPEQPVYWGQRVEPSPQQHAFWGGRDAQRDVLLGSGTGRLLDVGCGFGHFVAWANEHGWDAWGSDTDTWARENSVAPGRVVETPEQANPPFDVLTLWDVLEHIREPLPFLAGLREFLRPGGRIVVGSPNFAAMKLRWPVLRHFPERFNSLVRPEEHAVQFTEDGIRFALERAGFERVELLRPPLAAHRNPALDLAVRGVPSLRKGLFAGAYLAR